jgi:signal transduction histidine kinase
MKPVTSMSIERFFFVIFPIRGNFIGDNGSMNPTSAFLEQVPFGIVFLDSSFRILRWNRVTELQLQYAASKVPLKGKAITEVALPLSSYSEELRAFQKDTGLESYKISLSMGESYLDFTFYRSTEGYILMIQDLTAEKKIETNSIQSIIASQENERRRLAREIHDGIAPLLSSAKLELELFLEELHEKGADIQVHRLKRIRKTIDSISTDLRDLSHRLIPRLLEEFGLYSAFQNTINHMSSNSKAQVEYYSNLDPSERLDRDIELNLFRCGQELLHNAIKHSGAGKIVLQVIRHESSVVLMVEDDGVGFNVQEKSKQREGIGLTNIETRVRSLNGEFLIESVPDYGTLVSIEIPLH